MFRFHWHRVLLLSAVIALAFVAAPDHANAAVTINYTTSTNAGLSNYSIGDLTASAVFTIDSPSSGFLDINVTNTAAINAGLAAIFFNYNSLGAVLSTTATVVTTTQSGETASGSLGQQADGFGNYDYQLSFAGPPTYLQQGKSVEVKIAYTGTLTDAALKATSSGGNPGSPFVSAIDWKPLVAGNDRVISTGFGAGSLGPVQPAVPEPASVVAWSLLGIVGWAYGLRRRRAAF